MDGNREKLYWEVIAEKGRQFREANPGLYPNRTLSRHAPFAAVAYRLERAVGLDGPQPVHQEGLLLEFPDGCLEGRIDVFAEPQGRFLISLCFPAGINQTEAGDSPLLSRFHQCYFDVAYAREADGDDLAGAARAARLHLAKNLDGGLVSQPTPAEFDCPPDRCTYTIVSTAPSGASSAREPRRRRRQAV